MLHLGGQRVDEAERGKSSGPDPDGLGFELDKNQFVNKIQPSSWMSRLGVNTRGRCIRSGRSAHTSLRKISKREPIAPHPAGQFAGPSRRGSGSAINRGREERRDGAKLPLFKTVLDAVEKFHTVLMGHKW